MRITRNQYHKAVKSLPKLREAETIVNEWKKGIESLGSAAEHMEVLEVEKIDGDYVTKNRRKSDVPSEGNREAA